MFALFLASSYPCEIERSGEKNFPLRFPSHVVSGSDEMSWSHEIKWDYPEYPLTIEVLVG